MSYNLKSKTCYGKISGKPLTEYNTEKDAQSGSTFVLERYGQLMVPYQCDTCLLWHLSPIERQTEHTNWCCLCVDENGQSKDCYNSMEDAQRRAQILKNETGVYLNVYQCPEIDKDYSGTANRKSTTCTNKQGTYISDGVCY